MSFDSNIKINAEHTLTKNNILRQFEKEDAYFFKISNHRNTKKGFRFVKHVNNMEFEKKTLCC